MSDPPSSSLRVIGPFLLITSAKVLLAQTHLYYNLVRHFMRLLASFPISTFPELPVSEPKTSKLVLIVRDSVHTTFHMGTHLCYGTVSLYWYQYQSLSLIRLNYCLYLN